MTPPLSNKVALITGAARGIGKGVARALGEAGATLALNDISAAELNHTEAELRAAGIRCDSFVADISKFASANYLVKKIASKLGKIDILVNNAGIATPTDFLSLTEAEWDRVLNVNLKGTFFTTQAVLKHMLARKLAGRIVMMGSIAGKTGGVATSVAYDVSKAGMIVMARSLARRYSKYGITVNAVAPAFVDTTMLNDLKLTRAKSKLSGMNVIPRLAQPEDIANAVLFLVSDHSSFITGETLNVNGGRLMD